ncbi:transposase (fragment) [Xenorhabdus bovienii str. kraussei Becker Underwood]|uniref:Transposase n=1 Tax=Xenorhabdus bovienii str. kraussei Becker Underwood TaxID=1398204 RepID=A0A077PKV0_XENBV
MKKNTSRGSVALTEHQVSSLFFSESRTMSLIRNVFKRLHYPVDIIAQCVRGYLAYALSLRNLEEMMAERGIAVDHSTLFRWVHRWVPLIVKRYRRSKPEVECRWRMDETYIKIKGQWRYLYRAVDTDGNTVEFLLTAHRDKKAALRFFKKAMRQHGQPDGVTLDKSGANKAALDEINKEKLKNITTTNHSIHDLIFK